MRLWSSFLATTASALLPPIDAAPRARATEPDESALLKGHVQLTTRDTFLRAGEAYFDPTSQWIIFQAIPVPPEGRKPDPHYSMYVAKLSRDDAGRITAIEEPIRVSPEGSANTCGWFHPTFPGMILFGSTILPPERSVEPGYKSGGDRYVWPFPEAMDVVVGYVPQMADDPIDAITGDLRPVFRRPGYDAECSWSPDGRYVLYARVREEGPDAPAEDAPDTGPDADIWLHNLVDGTHTPLVTADGYDGGPFFSPDADWICYRSDRRGDDRLQLFIAKLERDAKGVPTGIEREIQVTDNAHVNWGPFWHPSGEFLIYATSEIGHHNYELFAIEVAPLMRPGPDTAELRSRRVTFTPGADVLPAFNHDGTLLMWSAQRGPIAEGESRPSSQIWIAEAAPPDKWFPPAE